MIEKKIVIQMFGNPEWQNQTAAQKMQWGKIKYSRIKKPIKET